MIAASCSAPSSSTPAALTVGYSFRRFTADDLPLANRWLGTAQVMQWWGDPGEQLVLLTEDLDEPSMRQWVVEADGRPFGYVQAYAPESWPQSHLADLPPGAVAIDAFIGEPDMLGRGHGSAFLRVFAETLIRDGASVVVIDPDARNERARRAYARAGFIGAEIVATDDGPAVVMTFDRRSGVSHSGAPRDGPDQVCKGGAR